MMSLEAFHFQIFGCGWDNVARDLESAGATVECFTGGLGTEADYKEIVRLVPAFDYYLYPGLDEGSLGFLDAVAAGVPTIVTPQGFHLDIPGGITHPFWNFEELAMIFQSLAIKRKEKGRAVAALTWSAYAKRHLAVWELMLTEQPIAVSKLREAGGSSSACNFEHAELYCGWKFHTTAWRRGVSRALSHIRQRMWRASSDVKR
jgi:hypothetical protein